MNLRQSRKYFLPKWSALLILVFHALHFCRRQRPPTPATRRPSKPTRRKRPRAALAPHNTPAEPRPAATAG